MYKVAPLSTFGALFLGFPGCFTTASFETFTLLTSGWILCTDRHTVSHVIQTVRERRGANTPPVFLASSRERTGLRTRWERF